MEKFFSTYGNRPKVQPEKNSGKSKTEKAGYIPAKRRIEDMILAGKRLDLARKEQFDFEIGKDRDGEIDPFRRPGVDLAEVSQARRQVRARYKAAQADKRASLELKKAADATMKVDPPPSK